MAKSGPKPIEIDAEQVRKLAAMHCTVQEIAAFFDCSRDTIERRYAAEINKGRQQGKMQLRDWQLQSARKGNVAMLIFLGKQYLGQSDKVEQQIDTKGEIGEKDAMVAKLVSMLVDKPMVKK